uniref:Lipoxygenase domain-containing protein n=1 Tax=Eptatretus burgeri TaxID=7764 RepID=A0A8C4QVB4_EPTBU
PHDTSLYIPGGGRGSRREMGWGERKSKWCGRRVLHFIRRRQRERRRGGEKKRERGSGRREGCKYIFQDGFCDINNVAGALMKRWKEDSFLGYQYRNGPNPFALQCCKAPLAKMPVNDTMVAPSLKRSLTLEQEMQEGNIYILDFKCLHGIEVDCKIPSENMKNAAPICMLYSTPEGELLPIAIQLNQEPSEDNPIFLPSDSETDWLLAKLWLQHSNCKTLWTTMYVYLRCTTEVFSLLKPYVKYALNEAIAIREVVMCDGGYMDQVSFSTFRVPLAHQLLFAFFLISLTFSKSKIFNFDFLSLPQNLESRGVGDLANFHFRDDGMKLWEVIRSFVSEIVDIYYKSDADVVQDAELITWSKVFHQLSSLFYISLFFIVFKLSNAGGCFVQFDWYAWIYNNPYVMRRPVPTAKNTTTMNDVMSTIPDVARTSFFLAYMSYISKIIEKVKLYIVFIILNLSYSDACEIVSNDINPP